MLKTANLSAVSQWVKNLTLTLIFFLIHFFDFFDSLKDYYLRLFSLWQKQKNKKKNRSFCPSYDPRDPNWSVL